MTDDVTIQIYTVEFSHPDYSHPGEMELIGTSEQAAISRVRGSAFHLFKDARWLDDQATYTVTEVKPFTSGWRSEHAD